MNFEGQTIVIIGGSSGMGLATARLVRRLGARVTITGTTEPKVREAAASLGDDVRAVVADVTKQEDVRRVFEGLSRVDHVYLAAGKLTLGKIADGDLAAFRREVEERIFGAIYVVREALPKMKAGSITLTSGIRASRPLPGTLITSIGVDAMEVMARGLPLEVAPIRVNAVSYGWIDTPLVRGLLGDNFDAVISKEAEALPVKRIGTVEEAAQAVAFLMSNGFVNGEVLHLDGGGRMV
jgi:NAD(P)-dependent dehydrogenase (short-subunit alcohol dehydrogenase family)